MKKIDMMHGPIGRKTIRFALLLALTGMLQQVFNTIDTIIMGQIVGNLGKVKRICVQIIDQGPAGSGAFTLVRLAVQAGDRCQRALCQTEDLPYGVVLWVAHCRFGRRRCCPCYRLRCSGHHLRRSEHCPRR